MTFTTTIEESNLGESWESTVIVEFDHTRAEAATLTCPGGGEHGPTNDLNFH